MIKQTFFSYELKENNINYKWIKKLFILKKGKIGIGYLILLNPIAVIFQIGSWRIILVTILILNTFMIWHFFYPLTQNKQNILNNNIKYNSNCYNKSKRFSKKSRNDHISSQTIEEFCTINDERTNSLINNNPMPSKMKIKAGETLLKCEPEDAFEKENCWTTLEAKRFNVRIGPNYKKIRNKAPSGPSLLELIGVDIFSSDEKIDNIGSHLDFSNFTENIRNNLFIVNCQIPNYAPSNPLWGERQGNGDGLNFITYFKITQELQTDVAMENPSSPAINLLKHLLEDEKGPIKDRFKAIGYVVNPLEVNLGRTERHLLDTYNGQPILTRPQHRYYKGNNYFEVDIDAHEFNYIARKGLSGVTTHFPNMIVDFGFVLEGQTDNELPEQILGCVRLCKVNVNCAVKF